MEDLTKHKIFTMEETKREVLLAAAMNKFAKNGYKKTTTDEIIAEAEISKGLLFHYFGTKKDLYVFLFKYAYKIIMDDYYAQLDLKQRDVLKRFRDMFLLKLKLTNKYPAIFDFTASAYYEKDPVVSAEMQEYSNLLYYDVRKELFKDIDYSLFKPLVDVEKALDVIVFTLRGYSESQASPEKRCNDYSKEHNKYIKEIDEYIAVLRYAFYKEVN
ncbi:TetR/AcrR family transcriptional regulator [Anaerocolumna sp. MB42-C2]|uniref:TetR/AcrR family transcriptional regulator n=1 Tax=Anaerocolumna sp. MB42-C2 TaxID=3070997 RepID=UPI0027DFAC55|nr:TetR/AcrR family transcriptional regulator [Anaerocolumna sp. MB42-C2]WMJ89042.1 TetR/AcrR family transcriptional regulator [Anaerocolumna sp. MB42-C2]